MQTASTNRTPKEAQSKSGSNNEIENKPRPDSKEKASTSKQSVTAYYNLIC